MNLQTLIISMTVIASGLLFVAIAVQAVLAAVLIHEAKKLQGVRSVHENYTALAASLAGLRKEHVSLEELVSTWMSRSATRAKRKKDEEASVEPTQMETPEEDMIGGVVFPSLRKN